MNNDFQKIELESLYSQLKDAYRLRASVLSVLALANITAVGYGVEARIAIFFLLGAAIASIALMADFILHKFYFLVLLQGLLRAESLGEYSFFHTVMRANHSRYVQTYLKPILESQHNLEGKIEQAPESDNDFETAPVNN